jgi:hypothetical protein
MCVRALRQVHVGRHWVLALGVYCAWRAFLQAITQIYQRLIKSLVDLAGPMTARSLHLAQQQQWQVS